MIPHVCLSVSLFVSYRDIMKLLGEKGLEIRNIPLDFGNDPDPDVDSDPDLDYRGFGPNFV